jgi:hypothetical protein
MRYLTLKSFRILNPDWKIILYTANCTRKKKPWNGVVEQDFFNYTGPNYMDKVEDLDIEIHEWSMTAYPNIGASHLSNFLKWHKLQAHGGIYADMDILWIQPLDKLYTEMSKANTAICITNYLSIGLLGSSIGNRMFKDFFEHAKVRYTPKRYQSVGVENIYDLLYNAEARNKDGSINFTKLAKKNILQDIRDRWPELIVYNLPFRVVYPFSCLEIDEIYQSNHELPEHVIGLHWYAGDPLSQKFNCTFSKNNWPLEECTFTQYAKRYKDG